MIAFLRLFALSVAASIMFAAGVTAGESRLTSNLKAGKGQVVVTYGTSLTAGGAWVGQLQKALDDAYPKLAKVVNSGASGMWSNWGLEHLEERVITKAPDTVFIEWAINDAFLKYETPVAKARENLEAMIDRILKAKPETEIILMTMDPPIAEHLERRPKIEEYYQMYREVARARKLLLIDHEPNWKKVLGQGEASYRKLVPDGIHPNAEGCSQVITPALLEAIGVKKAK